MDHSISVRQMVGFIFTGILGTFLHFLFELTGESVVAALFSAVNESIWEHMKLLYWPMFLFALIQYRSVGQDRCRFWCIKLAGMLTGLILIPVIYYTYTGVLGKSADWFNITIFFLAAGVAFRVETALFLRENTCKCSGKWCFAVILMIGAVFVWLTFSPPHIPLFEDPMTGTYGFNGG